jgi:DNA (cytosine-5)-methyltransferase 1
LLRADFHCGVYLHLPGVLLTAYYNEIDDYCCGWLSNLMDAGHITRGRIDDRSIVDVRPDDLAGYERCHFFAGIGGWDYSLSLCGYFGPVWTGSCPCQPFSAAGKGKSADDERHLWPAWFSLIRECKPPIVFGEQVEAAIGWGWLDAVFADLEAEGYACGAAVLPACGVGAPHIRQRLWFVADADGGDARAERLQRGGQQRQFEENGGVGGRMADATSEQVGLPRQSWSLGYTHSIRCEEQDILQQGRSSSWWAGGVGGLGHPKGERLQGPRSEQGEAAAEPCGGQSGLSGHTWACDWLPCTDGKARPVEPAIFPLVDGLSFRLGSGRPLEGKSRTGMLRAAGNAIVPLLAAQFVSAFLDVERTYAHTTDLAQRET